MKINHPIIRIRLTGEGIYLDSSTDLTSETTVDNIGLTSSFPKSLFAAFQEYGKIESVAAVNGLGSGRLRDLQKLISDVYIIRNKSTVEAKRLHEKEEQEAVRLRSLQTSLLKFLFKKKIASLAVQLENISESKKQLECTIRESYLEVIHTFNDLGSQSAFTEFQAAFAELRSASNIWDVVFTELNLQTKASAGTSVERYPVRFHSGGLNIIRSEQSVAYFQNFNGGDFLFYPAFILYLKSPSEITLIEYADLLVEFKEKVFHENPNDVPIDAQVVGETWERINKDGSPDKRFAYNPKMTNALYGTLHFKTAAGINDLYYVSDVEKARVFHIRLLEYMASIGRYR